jgi:hypothetical protein
MWMEYLATTFPSPPLPELPLTLLQRVYVARFALPAVLVIALVWAVSRRRRATPRWLTRTFNVTAVLSLVLFAATAALFASGYEGTLNPFGWPKQPITRVRLAASASSGRLYVGS